VAIEIAGHTFCSSVLSWAGCGNVYPWRGDTVGAKTAAVVGNLVAALPVSRTVWGGDWNHTLVGGQYGEFRRWARRDLGGS
jgi:predicted TIM-barrel fold metal-dependent hydrolase